MGIPDDVVLDGYTLIEQHAIDHEFLLRGSPLGTETPLLFALTIAGVLLVAASFFLRGGRSWPQPAVRPRWSGRIGGEFRCPAESRAAGTRGRLRVAR